MVMGRPFAGCVVCGASACRSNHRMAGLFRNTCPSCGAPRNRWKKPVKVDDALPELRGKPTESSLRRRMDADEAWQNAHEARIKAHKRLGLDKRAGDNSPMLASEGEPKREAVRAIEDKFNPLRDLVTAARAGDRYARRRADALYGRSWVIDRRHSRKSASGDK